MFYRRNDNGSENIVRNQEPATSSLSLILSPQSPKDTVMVDSVVMPVNGWVVARAIEGDRLSQVIEISNFLQKGAYKNIQISLGDFYDGEDLIVMIYEDQGDGTFNDMDLPALDDEGLMTAVYVRTGESLPSSIIETDPSSMPAHNMSGMAGMTRIRYTDNGFLPKEIKGPVGTMVEFVNESSMDMWVASNLHPEHEELPTFDQFRPYKIGGVYRYVFDKAGTWEYHDHLNPALEGVVNIQ